MMGFTADGQFKPDMIATRGKGLKLSTEQERKARADLAQSAPPVVPGADFWQSGSALQLTLGRVQLKNKQG